jgi:hypothetical protein
MSINTRVGYHYFVVNVYWRYVFVGEGGVEPNGKLWNDVVSYTTRRKDFMLLHGTHTAERLSWMKRECS